MGRKYKKDLHRGSIKYRLYWCHKACKGVWDRKQGQQEDGAKCGVWADKPTLVLKEALVLKEGSSADWNLFRE